MSGYELRKRFRLFMEFCLIIVKAAAEEERAVVGSTEVWRHNMVYTSKMILHLIGPLHIH